MTTAKDAAERVPDPAGTRPNHFEPFVSEIIETIIKPRIANSYVKLLAREDDEPLTLETLHQAFREDTGSCVSRAAFLGWMEKSNLKLKKTVVLTGLPPMMRLANPGGSSGGGAGALRPAPPPAALRRRSLVLADDGSVEFDNEQRDLPLETVSDVVLDPEFVQQSLERMEAGVYEGKGFTIMPAPEDAL